MRYVFFGTIGTLVTLVIAFVALMFMYGFRLFSEAERAESVPVEMFVVPPAVFGLLIAVFMVSLLCPAFRQRKGGTIQVPIDR
jgi:hypothetical protein